MYLPKTCPCFSRLANALILLIVLLLAGCATPMGVNKVSPRESYRNSMENALTDGVTSNATNIVLQRFDLTKEFKSHPASVIEQLHDKALYDERRDTLYALTELSYLYGEQLEKSKESGDHYRAPDYFLLASIYAYLFLLDDRDEPPPNAFDIRARTACDLYNFALWRGLATGRDGTIILTNGVRKLPVGTLPITLNVTKFPFQVDQFSSFEPADRYKIRGISIRNRTKGVGSALIGVRKTSQKSFSSQPVPISIFLQFNGNLAQLSDGSATASLELYSAYEDNILVVKGRHIPVETDTTTPMAYGLENSKIWDFGLGVFFGKEFLSTPNGLYLGQPYQPGRIPVIFVHGTFSNPAWWAEMFNTLYADPILRQKYQFWYFLYNSSAPVLVSAADLRDALRAKVTELDPEGKDPALREMVVVGHSQGGLLTKLTVVNTGDSLVRTLTGKDLDTMGLSEEKKREARRLLVIEPVTEVKRVVFISTPHRGSILSKNWVRALIKKLVTLPVNIIKTTFTLSDYFTDDIKKLLGTGQVPTSIDGMSPDNPVLKTLVETPLADGVTGHSIIAVKGDDDPQLEDDGVVAYTSAHIEGIQSELIVHSGHSCQANPFTIEEVRRILFEHLDAESSSKR